MRKLANKSSTDEELEVKKIPYLKVAGCVGTCLGGIVSRTSYRFGDRTVRPSLSLLQGLPNC